MSSILYPLVHSLIALCRHYRFPLWSLVFCGILLFGGVGTHPAIAQEAGKSLKVATLIAPPFVMQEKGQLTGFSIELWNEIAEELKISSQYVITPALPALAESFKDKQVDLAISAISITSEREQLFDFSQPMFEAGLQIMVRNPRRGALLSLMKALFSSTILRIVGVTSLLALIAAHIIWLVERRSSNSIVSQSYFPGIFEAAWWAASTLATQAEEMPKGALSRVLAIIWMFFGVLFVAYFTAVITAALTVQQLQGSIRGPNDLPGRIVATVNASTSARYLEEQQINTLTFPTINQAYDALLSEKADAIVFDAPILRYYAAHEGKGRVQMAGVPFRQENYGIVFPTNSPYRKPVNAALLKLRESGAYQRLYEQWFGTNENGG